MKNKTLLQNQKGFTLVELMISSGILMIALLGANLQYISQLQSESASNVQESARHVLSQVLSRVMTSAGQFMRVTAGNGDVLTYVGCYEESGILKGHDYDPPGSPQAGYVGVFLAGKLDEPAPDPETPGKYICTQGQGGVEIHVTWDPIVTNKIYLNAVVLSNTGRKFKVASKSLNAVVEL